MSVNSLKARLAKSRKGFTLIEIMIVVLIIGILLAIAVPNFVKARESSRAKSCSSNLKQIESAMQQWAMDNKKNGTDNVGTWTTTLVGTDKYIKKAPSCPSGGAYTVGNVDVTPSCDKTSTAYPHTADGQ